MAAQSAKSRKPVNRQQRRTKATRRKLMDAARAVFAQNGIDSARIDQIAEKADVGKGTFYYHFTGKAQLVREMIKNLVEELVTAIEARCKAAANLPELLDALIAAHVEFFGPRWEDFVLFFQGRSDLTLGDSDPGIETPFLRYLECVEGLLDSAIKHRLSHPVLRRIACAVVGFLSGYYSFSAIASQDEDIDATFSSLRGAMVSSLTRFIQEAAAAPGNPGAPA